MISSVGIFSIRNTREPGAIGVLEDPMAILQKGYSITIFLAVLTFGLVRSSSSFWIISSSFWPIEVLGVIPVFFLFSTTACLFSGASFTFSIW